MTSPYTEAMEIFIVVVVVAALVIAAILFFRNGTDRSAARGEIEAPHRVGPAVADFHIDGEEARVSFNVPLPDGDTDQVLTDLLIREAIEVVREKRHTLPIDGVRRVVAFATRGGERIEVGSVDLETPGQLPPPMRPELLPHMTSSGFDAFAKIENQLSTAPGLASEEETEMLESISTGVKLSREVEAGLRAQGLDPARTDACDLVLGVMRLAGYIINERSADTLDATKGGQRIFIRTVCHLSTDHPELDERQVARFVVDFVSSGADRGLCITEKFGPFEIYEREKREPRMRFITRERLQDFVDALTVG